MTRIHPNATAAVDNAVKEKFGSRDGELTEVLTVWRKSLLFNGNGFTVFNGKGELVFRVDNYASEKKGEILLMDAEGKPLLTIRKKKLSLSDHWLIYNGEETSNPVFSVKKQLSFRQPKLLAHVNKCKGKITSTSPCSSPRSPSPAFEVEGSYAQRCCLIYEHGSCSKLAEIRRKEANGGVGFGLDVFRLVVQQGFDAAIAMAIVILLEQMFGSRASASSSLYIKG